MKNESEANNADYPLWRGCCVVIGVVFSRFDCWDGGIDNWLRIAHALAEKSEHNLPG